jgi:hypothetical protein
MPGSALAEIIFIAAMMMLILIISFVAVYYFFKTYRKEMVEKKAGKILVKPLRERSRWLW